MKPPGRHFPLHNAQGSLLIEIMVATTLVVLLVGTLAVSLTGTIGKARGLRETDAGDQDIVARRALADRWDWGPRPLLAWWCPGPVLHIRVRAQGSQTTGPVRVGLWANGWLLAEQTTTGTQDSSGPPAEMQIGPQLWAGLAGAELVVRMAGQGGVWGTPWHLAVPEGDGLWPLPASSSGEDLGTCNVVVHRPGAGTSTLAASWGIDPLDASVAGLVFSLTARWQGWGEVTLDGRDQWWQLEEGRSVDIYY